MSRLDFISTMITWHIGFDITDMLPVRNNSPGADYLGGGAVWAEHIDAQSPHGSANAVLDSSQWLYTDAVTVYRCPFTTLSAR